MKENPADPRTVLCSDCLAPEGYGEMIGGSQREDDLDRLVKRIEEEKLPLAAYDWYLDLRRYGTYVHFGIRARPRAHRRVDHRLAARARMHSVPAHDAPAASVGGGQTQMPNAHPHADIHRVGHPRDDAARERAWCGEPLAGFPGLPDARRDEGSGRRVDSGATSTSTRSHGAPRSCATRLPGSTAALRHDRRSRE